MFLLFAVLCVDTWRHTQHPHSETEAADKDDSLEWSGDSWILLVAGAAFGAAGGGHHVIAVLTLPALCYSVYASSPSARAGFCHIWNCAMSALVVMFVLYGEQHPGLGG